MVYCGGKARGTTKRGFGGEDLTGTLSTWTVISRNFFWIVCDMSVSSWWKGAGRGMSAQDGSERAKGLEVDGWVVIGANCEFRGSPSWAGCAFP